MVFSNPGLSNPLIPTYSGSVGSGACIPVHGGEGVDSHHVLGLNGTKEVPFVLVRPEAAGEGYESIESQHLLGRIKGSEPTALPEKETTFLEIIRNPN
jgi:hypothetical protein